MRFPFRVTLLEESVRKVVSTALSEDIGRGDVTTETVVAPSMRAAARLRLKCDGVVAGLALFEAVFRFYDPKVRVTRKSREGHSYKRGRTLATVTGRARSILTCERVGLNLIQHLSGIATLTRRFVQEVEGTGVKIVDTRKTIPGLRHLEKYAVLVGGGHNHRLTLSDLVLIKDNHIKAAGGIVQAIARVREAGVGVPVEVEVGSGVDPAELRGLGIDIIMLDNWPLRDLRRAIKTIRGFPCRPLIEVSGGIGLTNVRKIALCGPDLVSIGCLTHSAPSLDISLDFEVRMRHG